MLASLVATLTNMNNTRGFASQSMRPKWKVCGLKLQPLIEMEWQFDCGNATPYNLVLLGQEIAHINSSDPPAAPAIGPEANRINATINGKQQHSTQ